MNASPFFLPKTSTAIVIAKAKHMRKITSLGRKQLAGLLPSVNRL
jgi:hypothetical protein